MVAKATINKVISRFDGAVHARIRVVMFCLVFNAVDWIIVACCAMCE